ncbi:hypothetical protein C1H46_013206, partial [Malus baccata]
VDLDLGNYERILDVTLTRDNNITSGKIYLLFFGQEEIAIPVHSNIEASCAAHLTADVLINFASYRSAAASSMAVLKQPTIRVVAIIAEGVVIAPATVGGIQARAFKIGDTAGTIDNIIHCKLYMPGSVGFVSKSVCS